VRGEVRLDNVGSGRGSVRRGGGRVMKRVDKGGGERRGLR
jgi:hypothetical protein